MAPAPEPYGQSGAVVYPRGTLAMAKSSQPNSGGSQFFMVYADSYLPPEYTVFGTIGEPGLQVLDKIAEGGVETPLVPIGGDRFKAGALSTISFERDASGRVSAVTRDPLDGGRRWWRGVRTP